MLIKVNSVGDRTAKVTMLDIDDYGSVIPVQELELELSQNDSVVQTLKSAPYAAVFTDDNGVLVLARGITEDELNREKEKTIDAASKKVR